MQKLEPKAKNDLKVLDFPENRENPFLSNLIIPKGKKNVIVSRQTDKALFSTITGEVDQETLFLAQKKDLDKEQFVKIFHSHLQIIFDLSKSTLKVFAYIASVTSFDDKVVFDIDDCLKYTGYNSKQTIYRSLAELLNADMIARTPHFNIYYINPQIFYKGDRIVLVQEYKLKKKKEVENNHQLKLL